MEPKFWDEQYKRNCIIGNKDFQTIYSATKINQNDMLVTIKEYLIHKGDNSKNEKIKQLFEREIELMNDLSKLNCENFVKLIENKNDIIKGREDNYYYIVREYCFGNLEDFITMNEGKLEPGLIQLIMKQLNNAFKILKDKKIIHRNIKPSNILFSYKEDNNYIMKLSGLNYYKKENNNPPIDKTENDYFIPPKGLNNMNEQYDLWSIGAIMYFMCFGDYNIENRYSEIKDNDLKDLIEKCLKNIKNIISWDDYLNHQFFKNHYVDYDKKENPKNIDMNLIIKYHNTFMEISGQIEKDYTEVIKQKTTEKRNKLIKNQNSYYDTKIKEIEKIFEEMNNIRKKYS